MTEAEKREMLQMAAKAVGMVDYNQDTGSMTWRAKGKSEPDAARWNSRYAGQECGTIDDKGYRRILFRFDGSVFRIRAHRLAWLISFGFLPAGEIDHINQDKTDNRLSNLRDVPKSINQRNGTRKSNNTSGVAGVSWHKQRGKWCAQASMNGKHHHLGLFNELTAAETAARKFRAAHGFTGTHGRQK